MEYLNRFWIFWKEVVISVGFENWTTATVSALCSSQEEEFVQDGPIMHLKASSATAPDLDYYEPSIV